MRHEMDISQWAILSGERQQKIIKRFSSDTGKANANVVVSADRTRTAQKHHMLVVNLASISENALRVQGLLQRKGDCKLTLRKSARELATSVRRIFGSYRV